MTQRLNRSFYPNHERFYMRFGVTVGRRLARVQIDRGSETIREIRFDFISHSVRRRRFDAETLVCGKVLTKPRRSRRKTLPVKWIRYMFLSYKKQTLTEPHLTCVTNTCA